MPLPVMKISLVPVTLLVVREVAETIYERHTVLTDILTKLGVDPDHVWTEEDDTRTLELEVRDGTDENGIITQLWWTRHTMSTNIGEGGDEWNW